MTVTTSVIGRDGAECITAPSELAHGNGVEVMTIGPVEPFKIENESEADDYLKQLFEKPEYRSMDEAYIRAQELIEDSRLKIYFIDEAKERLKAYGRE